jgi:hypothetical protein
MAADAHADARVVTVVDQFPYAGVEDVRQRSVRRERHASGRRAGWRPPALRFTEGADGLAPDLDQALVRGERHDLPDEAVLADEPATNEFPGAS